MSSEHLKGDDLHRRLEEVRNRWEFRTELPNFLRSVSEVIGHPVLPDYLLPLDEGQRLSREFFERMQDRKRVQIRQWETADFESLQDHLARIAERTLPVQAVLLGRVGNTSVGVRIPAYPAIIHAQRFLSAHTDLSLCTEHLADGLNLEVFCSYRPGLGHDPFIELTTWGAFAEPFQVYVESIAWREEAPTRDATSRAIAVLRQTENPTYESLLLIARDTELPADVREGTCRLLAGLGKKQAVTTLVDILTRTGESEEMRWVAAQTIAELCDTERVHEFITVFRTHADPQVRQLAGSILGQWRSTEAVESLRQALQDTDEHPDVRSRAAESLGEIAMWNKRAVFPAVPALHAALSDEDFWVRHDSMVALSYFRDKRMAPRFIELLQADASEEVRGAAASSLAWTRSRRAVRALIGALSDPSAYVRLCSAEALAGVGDTRALPELERLAGTDDTVVPDLGTVRDKALEAIDQIRRRCGPQNPHPEDTWC